MIGRLFLQYSEIWDRFRANVYRPFLKKCGRGVRIAKTCFISGVDKIELGDNIYLNRGCILQGGGGISIGNNTLIGPYVQIYSEEHDQKDYTKTVRQKITIGKNCWICANVIILKGSNIPDGTVIPAGTIVRRNR